MTISSTQGLLDSKLKVAWQVLARFLVDSKQLTLEALELELVNVSLETSFRCEKYAEPPQRFYSSCAGCGWQKINHDAIMPELVSSLTAWIRWVKAKITQLPVTVSKLICPRAVDDACCSLSAICWAVPAGR